MDSASQRAAAKASSAKQARRPKRAVVDRVFDFYNRLAGYKLSCGHVVWTITRTDPFALWCDECAQSAT